MKQVTQKDITRVEEALKEARAQGDAKRVSFLEATRNLYKRRAPLPKAQAVKLIFNRMEGGLPEAVAVYNYLGCFGEIGVTSDMIEDYFR